MTHVPWLQALDELSAIKQWLSHPPQLFASLAMFLSHPSRWSQSAQPGSQAPMTQTPSGQVAAAWFGAQAASQSPQLVSVYTSRSQPSSWSPACGPLQFRQPDSQVGTHNP